MKEQYKHSLLSWFLFDYCLPIIFIVGFWPVAAYLLKIPHAFERVFYTADLMPVASLLMLSASREIEMENKLKRTTKEMNFYKQLGIFFPILMLFTYGILRYFSMTHTIPTEATQSLEEPITLIPYICFGSMIVAGSYCFMTKWGIISSLKAELHHA